ncbi:MAG: bifunctional adenosylcobinamide kinase/adenosylcobinamide-phosphate guanylyltransferase [Bacillota bacterium]|nr:bifunctional adenosylcobinamide kinase/adenosylcobinamide-phosphate guanylyltransferase [Bacillota bacterium]
MEEIRGKLILVTGGARSGKSTFAENYARNSGKRVIYLATAAGDDEEMRTRIKAHQQRRPAEFITMEERYYPHRIFEKEGGAGTFILLDCLTLLLTNLLLKEETEESQHSPDLTQEREKVFKKTLEYMSSFTSLMRSSAADALVVTNEVGMGLVPDNALGRIFCDLSGRANQIVGAQADEVWVTVCGIAQKIK